MLQGKLSAQGSLSGTLHGAAGLSGSLMGGGRVYPAYDGPVEFEPSEDAQTAETHGKAVLSDITIDAIPSGYVGSAVDRRDSDDLAASGATVTAPAGYYAEGASKSVAGGTEGTPTASKTVSGHTAAVTPTVTNSAGYIQGGTHAGTPVTVSASELVSGNYTVTSSGTHDVAEYASASVAAATPTNDSDSEYITSSGVRKWRYRPKTIVPTAGWAAQRSASNPINGFWQTFDAIPTGTTVTPSTSSQTIGGADTMMEGAVTVAAIPPEYIVPSGTKAISANGEGIDVASYAAVDVDVQPSLQSKAATPSTSQQTISPDTGYDGLSSVQINAMPSMTLPSQPIETHTGSEKSTIAPSTSRRYLNIPAGYNDAERYYVISNITVESPTFTQNGTYVASDWEATGFERVTVAVPQNTFVVTVSWNASTQKWEPDCTWAELNEAAQAGKRIVVAASNGVADGAWLSGGTLEYTTYKLQGSRLLEGFWWFDSSGVTEDETITAVFPEGTLSITSSGTHDVTNYASASVASGGATASVTKGTVSNHSITVTPSVTRTAGYVTAGTSNGTAVTVSASELVSGSETKTENGTYDVTNLAELVVNVAGSSVKTATGTFTGNGTRTIDVACTFEPDIVYFTSNPGTTASSGTVAAIIVRDMMTATRYRNNSTTNSHYAIPDIANLNTSGSSYSWRATYANSKVTLYCYSNNVRGLLTGGRTYSYTFIKWK